MNHFDIATEGLRKDHRWIARLGFFTIEVTPVEPPKTELGGGGVFYSEPTYIVTIKLVYKGKEYTQSREIMQSGLNTLEKVIVFFKGVGNVWDRVKISAEFVKSYLSKLASINIRYTNRSEK